MLRRVLTGVGLLLFLAVFASVGVRQWLRSDAVRATVERQATAALGMPVRIGGARAAVFPRLGLDLRNVEVGDPTRARVDRVSVATGLGLIFSRRVEAADVRLTGGYLDASLIAGIAALQAPPPGYGTPPSRSRGSCRASHGGKDTSMSGRTCCRSTSFSARWKVCPAGSGIRRSG